MIDEIGKMELFSNRFEIEVKNLLRTADKNLIVTIPVQKGKPIPLVEAVRSDKMAKLYTVNGLYVNRGNEFVEICFR